MAISITSIESLQTYLEGVLNRANHHAESVEGVALTLLGAIIWRSTDEISVREYNGSPANMIWFYVGENRFAMTYNHTTGRIELKEKSNSGKVIADFDNSSTYQQIVNVFRNL